MSLIYAESFELYLTGNVVDYLASCGIRASGTAEIVADRSASASALQINTGEVTHNVTTRASKVVFGFACRHTDDVEAWRLTADFRLTLADKPLLGGAEIDYDLSANRWHYYEVVINKTTKTVQLWVDNEQVFSGAMPAALQFMTTYSPIYAEGIRIDDLAVCEENRVGPIAVRARFTTEKFPWTGNTLGDELKVRSTDPAGSRPPLAAGVTARLQIADRDNREVVLTLGDQAKGATLTTTPRYSTALFTTDPEGKPWTATNAAAQPFGVRITK